MGEHPEDLRFGLAGMLQEDLVKNVLLAGVRLDDNQLVIKQWQIV